MSRRPTDTELEALRLRIDRDLRHARWALWLAIAGVVLSVAGIVLRHFGR